MKTFESTRAKRFDVGIAALVGLNVLLAATFFAVLFEGTELDAILATQGSDKTPSAFDLSVPTPLAADSFDVIQAQPLFHVSRSFYTPIDPAAVVTTAMPPDYRIAGVMSMPNKSAIAFLVHNQSAERIKIQKGDMVEGWSVEDVSSKAVVLSMNGRKAEITASKILGSLMMGMQALSAQPAQAASAQNGMRILGGGTPRNSAVTNPNTLPKVPPGSVGARLYQPPPTQ